MSKTGCCEMRFSPPLVEARLLRRYKRFLADMRLVDGREVVAHCPNPGAMTGLSGEGQRCWLRFEDAPHRRLSWSWIFSEQGDCLVGVHTMMANQLAMEAIDNQSLDCFAAMSVLKKEPRLEDDASVRLDFLLRDQNGEPIYLEVKSVTLAQQEDGRQVALFPDAVTKRGAKHMKTLASLARQQKKSMVLFVIQRADCDAFRSHDSLDAAYGASLREARAAGVHIVAASCMVTPQQISLARMTDIQW